MTVLRRWRVTVLLGAAAPLLAACLSSPAADDPAPMNDEPRAAGQVTSGGTMTMDRAAHSATLLDDGRVLIVGGIRSGEIGLDTAEVFDPATGRFEAVGRLGSERAGGQSAVLLPDGRVLVVGGWAGGDVINSAELFDPRTGQFTPTGSTIEPRADAAAALLGNGRVLLAGGFDGESALRTAELYDPGTGTFTATGSLTTARSSFGSAVLRDGRVLVVGGQGAAGDVLSSAEVFDPAAGRFSGTGSMESVRYKTAAVPLSDGRVLVVGGSDERDWDGQYDTAELYDAARGTFSRAPAMHRMRFKIAAAVASLADGRVLVAGSDPTVEVYDPASGRLSSAPGTSALSISTRRQPRWPTGVR